VDTTNIEVTTIKAKDGTSAGSIADSTGVVTLASSVLTTTDINGGTVDGAVIGGSSAAAITGTTITATGDVTIPDKIIHAGDTNTAIRFPAADTVTVETSGTERLRITSAGDVGIGATPTGFGRFEVTQATNKRILTSTAAAYGGNALVGINDIGGEVAFGIAGSQLIFATGATERARIDSSGNLGVGTSSPAFRIHAAGAGNATLRVDSTNGQSPELSLFSAGVYDWRIIGGSTLRFLADSTEVARIDGSGNLLVGKTATNPTGATGFEILTANAAVFSTVNTSGASNFYHVYNINATNNGYRFYVKVDGGVVNFSANNSNLSDERVKTDISPVGSYWEKIKALEVVTYKYRDQSHEDDNIGVIAQQVESVAPEFVSNDGFGETPADGVPLKSIYEADLHYAALKALQEAMARIEALEARITALEA
jgi:hypothetical protein